LPDAPRFDVGLEDIAPEDWDRLHGGNPTLTHAFLDSLHRTGCAAPKAGWRPRYLTLWREGRLAGAVPLYLKAHSYGEYVFDWAWAEAYERHGVAYYPKLLAAVPFTPATGPRLLAEDEATRTRLAQALLAEAKRLRVSSLHVLFPSAEDGKALESEGCMVRSGVQFHWRNAGYRDFEDFLAALSHDKRKKIRQERRRVAEAGVGFRLVTGREAKASDWDFFNRCYERTYHEHRSTPYLNREFFGMLGERMPDNVLLVIAEQAGSPVAAALNLFSGSAMYGRYWGAMEFVPGLHFEACYYQAIGFAIGRGISLIEGGAQGAHKHARGFLPERTRSCHWLADPRFAQAVDDFLGREGDGINEYVGELADRSPFRKEG